eukprot:1391942-Amorphochlora_amoeboformis.AAC.1
MITQTNKNTYIASFKAYNPRLRVVLDVDHVDYNCKKADLPDPRDARTRRRVRLLVVDARVTSGESYVTMSDTGLIVTYPRSHRVGEPPEILIGDIGESPEITA